MDTKPKNDKERVDKTLELLDKSRVKLLGEKLSEGYFEIDDLIRLRKYLEYAKRGIAVFDDVGFNKLKQEFDMGLINLLNSLVGNFGSVGNERYELEQNKKDADKEVKGLFHDFQSRCKIFLNVIQQNSDVNNSTSSNYINPLVQPLISLTCFEEQGKGWLKFGNEKPIELGSSNNQPYKLIKYLVQNLNVLVGIGAVYEAMTDGKSKKHYTPLNKSEMLRLIQITFKDLQKGSKVNRLKLTLDNKWSPNNVRLILK